MSLYRTLENTIQIEDKEERDACLAGTELTEKCNKILMLSNKHGWECAEAYSRNPLADNSDNEKKINPITYGRGGFLAQAITFLNAAQRRVHLES